MWTDFFDKIYVVNLAKRTDRMKQAKEQLDKYNIPFERWEAIENLDGAEGLRLTMIELFTHAINSNYLNVLVFEDDVDVIDESINEVMENVVHQIPYDYDIIYLGCQLSTVPTGFYWTHLMKCKQMQSTHAAFYSLKVMKEILASDFFAPIDNCFIKIIQPKGNCYAVYPILCSQIVSKSDIYTSEPEMNWKKFIEVKYYNQIERMKTMGRFIREPKKQLINERKENKHCDSDF